jgi:parvulin-like peptidyl-prolyl isomerase
VLQGAAEAVGVAFGLGVGQVSDPIETDAALYVLRTTRKVAADSMAWRAQIDAQRAEAVRQARQARLQAVFASLRSAARVQDYREELARLAREQEEQGLIPGGGSPLGF